MEKYLKVSRLSEADNVLILINSVVNNFINLPFILNYCIVDYIIAYISGAPSGF